MLRLTLGVLRWPPAVMWSATPREIAAALGRSAAAKPIERSDLAALMRRFPDER